jgi:hypothetical protein
LPRFEAKGTQQKLPEVPQSAPVVQFGAHMLTILLVVPMFTQVARWVVVEQQSLVVWQSEKYPTVLLEQPSEGGGAHSSIAKQYAFPLASIWQHPEMQSLPFAHGSWQMPVVAVPSVMHLAAPAQPEVSLHAPPGLGFARHVLFVGLQYMSFDRQSVSLLQTAAQIWTPAMTFPAVSTTESHLDFTAFPQSASVLQ